MTTEIKDKPVNRRNKGYYQVRKYNEMSGLYIWYLYNKNGVYITAGHDKHDITAREMSGKNIEFTVQYAIRKNKPAVSDWQEYSTTIKAFSRQQATSKFNKSHQRLGSWLILDVYPKQ